MHKAQKTEQEYNSQPPAVSEPNISLCGGEIEILPSSHASFYPPLLRSSVHFSPSCTADFLHLLLLFFNLLSLTLD